MDKYAQQSPQITDSPWFWFALFTAVGFSALMATGGKFGKRQSGIERRYQARQWVWAEGEKPKAESGISAPDAAAGSSSVPNYSTPKKTLIPIWPLAIILGILCAGSIAMLLRERFHAPP